ncbi:MAG TPA: hypothetical protein VNJ54_12525 [Plantibacter sp.]|uniref:hypothetical protein n=1 Tax=unclassified Plantibacter TaxID=2624265 RepID=UPI002BFFFF8E|nr:hypothetical protein [Plantibacter sp.]
MTEVLHLGALLPAALGACCTVGGRRGVIDLGSAIVMLAAMLDLASGAGVIHPLLWACALMILAVVSAVRLRVARPSARRPGVASDPFALRHRAAMVVHTSGGLLIMAALVCAMTGHASNTVYAENDIPASTHHLGGISLAGVLIAGAIAGYLALSARLAVDAARARRRLVTVELGSMAASIVAMGLAAAM